MERSERVIGRLGRLLVIGGAEDPDEDRLEILPHFVEMCGGRSARIVICGSPSEKTEEKERKYGELFRKIGVADVFEAGITERHDGEKQELLDALASATGVFFTGGDQLRLTATVAGTEFDDRLRERLWSDRLVVGGTSAGAAAMSSTMITGGPRDGTVRRADIQLAPGLSLWRDVVIDTHFAQRGRISRLLAVLAQNPHVIAVGIDENTAIEVIPGREFTVIGRGAVFVIDGRVTHSNAAEISDEEVLAATDVVLHVLPAGYKFDLRNTRPVLPAGESIEARAAGR